MGIRMKTHWNDGKRVIAPGGKSFDFTPREEARLVRVGLAEELSPEESLEHARLEAGFAAQPSTPPEITDESPVVATMAMRRDDLLDMADARGVAIETDDNKADLVRKINEAG